MSSPCCGLVLALALAFSVAPDDAAAAGQAPKISRPKPAPPRTTAMPPLPPAVIDNTLAIGGDAIRARKVDSRMNVEVLVNGRGPYRFLVDSGADTSVVGTRIAHDLQLPLGTPVVLNGMTERSIVDRVKVADLTLGSSTIRNLEVPALREADLGGDGMIGIDVLVRQRLMMDFDKRVIKIEDASKPVKHYPDEIVIIARRRLGQLILTQVRAAGLPLDAVIDTGSEITIGNLALRDKLVRRKYGKLSTIAVMGVTGKVVQLQLAQIAELRLGPVTLLNVPIAFADVPPFKMFGLANEPALLLGTDILETFRRVSLDFASRKVRFQLKRCTTELVTISAATVTRLSSDGDRAVCGRQD